MQREMFGELARLVWIRDIPLRHICFLNAFEYDHCHCLYCFFGLAFLGYYALEIVMLCSASKEYACKLLLAGMPLLP